MGTDCIPVGPPNSHSCSRYPLIPIFSLRFSSSQYHPHAGPDLNIFQNFASRRSLSELIYQNMVSNHFGFFLQQRYCIIFHGKIRNSEQFYLEIIENIFYYFLLCFFVRSTNHLYGERDIQREATFTNSLA